MNKGKLYLIPVFLGDDGKVDEVFPNGNIEILNKINYFIAENDKLARRFLKRAGYSRTIQEAEIGILNEHTRKENVLELLQPTFNGFDIGLLSDAGCPGIADPGADVVQWAHDIGIQVVPLVGPSSILLSLMASGMNGQQFAFLGYIPIGKDERKIRLRELSITVLKTNQTQIFIETPYRNMQILEDIIKYCNPELRLCIASNLSQPEGWIKTKPISLWKNQKVNIHKIPCVFLLGV